MTKIIDGQLLDVMRELPHGWEVERFDRAGMGWLARIKHRKSEFQLVSDRGYIDIARIIDGKPQSIDVPERLRLRITPRQVATLVLQNVAS